MPSASFIFTSTPLSKGDITLGSLIPDVRYPHQDAVSPLSIPSTDISQAEDKNFDGRLRSESSSFFRASLTRIFTASASRDRGSTLGVTAKQAHTYQLRQPARVFEQLCELDDVKKWLEKQYRNKRKAVLVTGYRTLVDAQLVQEERAAAKGAVEATVPVGALAGVDPTPAGVMDVGAAAGHSRQKDETGAFETVGERVYAVCYRKIVLGFVRDEQTADLKPGNKWKAFGHTRGKNYGTDKPVYEASIAAEDVQGSGESQTFVSDEGVEEIFAELDDEESDVEDDEM